MKIICSIFSIYIICLLAYPCQDSCVHSDIKSTNHEQDDDDCHVCPPFCICNCCHVNTLITLKTILEKVITVPVLVVCIYKESSIKDIIHSIWQPPKL